MYGNRPRPPSPYKEGPVFIAALKHGPVFIQRSFHSAFTVKCKQADVFSYYPPQEHIGIPKCTLGNTPPRPKSQIGGLKSPHGPKSPVAELSLV